MPLSLRRYHAGQAHARAVALAVARTRQHFRRHLSNGAAEVLKMALVKDAELFDLLHEHGRELLAQRFLADSARTDTTSARVLRLAIARMLEVPRDVTANETGAFSRA